MEHNFQYSFDTLFVKMFQGEERQQKTKIYKTVFKGFTHFFTEIVRIFNYIVWCHKYMETLCETNSLKMLEKIINKQIINYHFKLKTMNVSHLS